MMNMCTYLLVIYHIYKYLQENNSCFVLLLCSCFELLMIVTLDRNDDILR